MPTGWLVTFIGTSKVFSVCKKGRVAVMGKFKNSAPMLAECKSWVNLRIVLAVVFQNDGTLCDFVDLLINNIWIISH